jgi:signal transduction histidine kinase
LIFISTATALINDVLDYSAIEANKRNIDKEEIDLKELAKECLRTIRPLSDKKSIVSILEIPDGTLSLFADVRAIKQIFINLLSNAIKFTPMNGKVSIKIQEKDGNHIIQFIDTGDGIEEKNIARILEPFARVENDPHLPQEGTGLGLSIVQSLVHLHQGTLDIESIVDQGTTITIKIPSV